MANNVNTNVTFCNLNDAGKQKLEKILSRVRTEDSVYRWFGDLWVDGEPGSPTYEDTENYEWTIENIGPKWCYIEDQYDTSIQLVSAWSAPFDGVTWLVSELSKESPGVYAEFTYEDEMPNFAGAALITDSGIYDYREWSSDELSEMLHEDYPEMLDHWDADNEEGDDEYYEMFSEYIWENLGGLQHSTLITLNEEYKQSMEGLNDE